MKNRQLSLMFFLIAQLYIYVMTISFNNLVNVKILSYISIILCFIIGLFMFCKTNDYFIMILALFFSLISDTVFIFFDNFVVVSLISLNIVQILYFLRIYPGSNFKKSNLLSRILSIPLIILLSFIVLKDKIDINVILWVIFIVNLFINILFTIKEIGLNNLFPIGLLLLFIYGILLMFISLPNYVIVDVRFIEFLSNLPFDIRWMFYLPALSVLTCSIFTVNRRNYSKINRDS